MAENGGAGAAEPAGAAAEAGAGLAPAAAMERQVSQLGAALSGEAGTLWQVCFVGGATLHAHHPALRGHLPLPICHRPLHRAAPSLPVPPAGDSVVEAVEEAKPAGGSQKDVDVEGLGEGDQLAGRHQPRPSRPQWLAGQRPAAWHAIPRPGLRSASAVCRLSADLC